MTQYAFCETAGAGPNSPIHIRQLTDAGRKESGGADSPALCLLEVAWDISGVPTDERDRAYYRNCKLCVRELEKRLGVQS